MTPSPAIRCRRAVALVASVLLVLATAACGSDDAATTATGTEPSATVRLDAGTTASSSTSTAVETSTTTPESTTTTVPMTAAPSTPAPIEPSTPPAPTAPASVAPLPAGASSVFVLGDSVLLGTTMGSPPPMVAALPGWSVTLDCEGSRRLAQGIGVLEARRAEIGRVAVIQLGNNYIPGEGGTFGQQIDQAMAILEGTDRVVWVTVGEALSGRAELNAEIRAAAQRHPTIVVADWAALVAADPSLAPGDGLHLSNQGRVALSDLVAGAVGPAPG